MITTIAHIGITVAQLDRSIHFYQNILGLTYRGSVIKQGNDVDKLFNAKGCIIKVAYLSIDFDPENQPLMELIEFHNPRLREDNDETSALEATKLCFQVEHLNNFIGDLERMGIDYLTATQYYDLRINNYTHSKAVYLRDPDGNILEFIEQTKV